MSVDERLDMERQYRDQESNQARYASRLKSACCRECGGVDGMKSIHRETLAQLSKNTLTLLGSWHSEPGNDEYLFRPCRICNWNRDIPDGYAHASLDDISAWLDRDPMAPDYEALAAEPVAATAGQDSRDSAGI